MTAVLIAAVAVLVVAIVLFVDRARRSRRSDGVATFRRQIDALSPEARRPVVDQVQQLEDDAAESPPDRAPPEDPA